MVSGDNLLAQLRRLGLDLADVCFEPVMDALDRTQIDEAGIDGVGIGAAQVQHFPRANDVVRPGGDDSVPVVSAQKGDKRLSSFAFMFTETPWSTSTVSTSR